MNSQLKHYNQIYERLRKESNPYNNSQKQNQHILQSQLLRHYQDQLVRKPIDQRRMRFKNFVADKSKQENILNQLYKEQDNKYLLEKIDRLKKERQLLQAQNSINIKFNDYEQKKYHQDHSIQTLKGNKISNKKIIQKSQPLKEITKQHNKFTYEKQNNKKNGTKNNNIQQIISSSYDKNQRIAERIKRKWMDIEDQKQQIQDKQKVVKNKQTTKSQNKNSTGLFYQTYKNILSNQNHIFQRGRQSKMQYLRNYQSLGNPIQLENNHQYKLQLINQPDKNNLISKQQKIFTQAKINSTGSNRKGNQRRKHSQSVHPKFGYKRLDINQMLRDYTTNYQINQLKQQPCKAKLQQNQDSFKSSPHFQQNKDISMLNSEQRNYEANNQPPKRLVNWNQQINRKNQFLQQNSSSLVQSWLNKIKKRLVLSKQVFVHSEYKNEAYKKAHLQNTFLCQQIARQQLKNKICAGIKKKQQKNNLQRLSHIF